jgi:hypothetical protein
MGAMEEEIIRSFPNTKFVRMNGAHYAGIILCLFPEFGHLNFGRPDEQILGNAHYIRQVLNQYQNSPILYRRNATQSCIVAV